MNGTDISVIHHSIRYAHNHGVTEPPRPPGGMRLAAVPSVVRRDRPVPSVGIPGAAGQAPTAGRGGTCDARGMQQRVSLITLGVADVGRARAFYEALGWSGESPDGEVVFFQAGGM